MNIVFVYNPNSGSALPLDVLRAKCDESGIKIQAFIAVEEGYEKKLKRYAKKDQTIAAYGGDGTISSVANIVAGTRANLAPLPGGTLNHFTKDLGISQEFDKALRGLKKGQVKTVDVAEVNGTIFLNNSSIGLYPSSLQTREHFEDKLGKWPAAVIGGIRTFIRYRTYELTISGENVTTPFIFIGNNDYHLDKTDKAGRKRLDKGILSVYTINAASRRQLLGLLGWALVGRLSDAPEIKAWTAKEVTIHAKKPQLKISRDGELDIIATPLNYKILPSRLRIIGN